MALTTKVTENEFTKAVITHKPYLGDVTVMQKILTFAGNNLFDGRGNFIPINWWNIVKLIQIAKFVIDLIQWIVKKSKEQ